jgi:hypothetical protein
MTPETDLLEAYRRWRQWTEVEGLAIGGEDWPKVTECQAAKRELQPIILRRTSDVLSGMPDPTEFHRRIRPVVQELITLEHHNSEILGRKHEELTCRKAELSRSARNLRRLHGCYAQAAPPNWQSFS